MNIIKGSFLRINYYISVSNRRDAAKPFSSPQIHSRQKEDKLYTLKEEYCRRNLHSIDCEVRKNTKHVTHESLKTTGIGLNANLKFM
ncbi:hypothetical protein CHS0354_002938 [Potamilus streckersoni]|uniref:Uncharacterized protein n=1 Tax=Potamilus streckersoni TaxID=2493646 RepID=A0AAE0VI98_9BIVA|nr:hypothetical protein CHS0354_002938 [Potamilus streckersoni]